MQAIEMIILFLGIAALIYMFSREEDNTRLDSLKTMNKFCSRCGSHLEMDPLTRNFYDRKTGQVAYVAVTLFCPRKPKQNEIDSSPFHSNDTYTVAPNQVEAIKEAYIQGDATHG